MIINFPTDRVKPVQRVLFPQVVRFPEKVTTMNQMVVMSSLAPVMGAVLWMAFVGFMFQALGLGPKQLEYRAQKTRTV